MGWDLFTPLLLARDCHTETMDRNLVFGHAKSKAELLLRYNSFLLKTEIKPVS